MASGKKDGTYLIMNGGFDENTDGNAIKPHCNWHALCINDGGGYAQHIYEITDEVC